MSKTCFVIMGYGIKQGIDLDIAYKEIIKPCIKDNKLEPVKIFENNKDNAFRCDEIIGGGSIDYKFVMCLNQADIVIADISTMNNNAIYELGARHALKPRSTILLCAKTKRDNFKFFDLQYVPIIFYEHKKTKISPEAINQTKDALNEAIRSCISSTSQIPDNPIQRALAEHMMYKPCGGDEKVDTYGLYKEAKDKLDNNHFDAAYNLYSQLYEQDSDEETLLALTLARYKMAEQQGDCKGLLECIELIRRNCDLDNSTSESVFGRLAAINLRLFDLLQDRKYYCDSLEYYRRGSTFGMDTLYCPRNYCALLMRVCDVTEDKNIIREYYYTAKHYSRLFYEQSKSKERPLNSEESIYYSFNLGDLKFIHDSNYKEHEDLLNRVNNYTGICALQRDTIFQGVTKLHNCVETVENVLDLIQI